ncbi:hypothetical protein EU534_01620 [Candidatus Heimdallarchaeota archaeon]|nr:MAG: hypothetical protein EU534_01620 [Candidatus Heimdallarchaeota archaeon]
MNPNDEESDSSNIFHELMRKFSYQGSLLEHWMEVFGIDYTMKLIDSLRQPMKSIWVQVNTNKIDFDSLLDIFSEQQFKAKKHEYFDDFIEVEVEKREFNDTLEELPQLRVDHESSTGIALGKDVQTANVTRYDDFNTGDSLCIVDGASNVIAKGVAVVNSSEIPSLTQRNIASVKQSRAYAPPLTEMRIYRRGYFNILTPIQALGVKSLKFDNKDNIIVMSTDKGDVAGYIAEITNHKVPITVLAQNEMQVKAIRKNLDRVKSKAIRIHHTSFKRFLKERHEIKYTKAYVEPQNSRTAVIPIFSSNLGYGLLKRMAEDQKKLVNDLYKCLHKRASVAYVTHSIDYFENEEILQSISERAYYKSIKPSEELRKLKEQKKIGTRPIQTQYKQIEKQILKSTIFLDPIETKNSGGFLTNFIFAEKEN